ncbi:BtpA/SgcQ family protein [Jiella marina]|uniref:BtpA/SgcQ family protein n=1 Tax=Jiella sp. LLJ827 TaxID=2917712 RepID=UPI00210107DC|nr:BtpA/SgcQ family protein [Jiella sp. LLJ827]MCQ0986321.1 hypothetical protein [Jiella sp. LLJ827]
MPESSLPKIIGALQLPPFGYGAARPLSWYEDFLLSNAETFVKNGITAIKVQDETRERGSASPRTIARMASLGRSLRREFPELFMGIIVQAHDAISPLAIADAAGADFVRLKVFTGASVNSEGIKDALGVDATRYREEIDRSDIRILADVHDRTSVPLNPVPHDMAANWAEGLGADALVITGSSFEDSLERIAAARQAGVKRPIVLGGGVTAGNVREALSAVDSVVVSTALVRPGASDEDMNRWDARRIAQFVEAAG